MSSKILTSVMTFADNKRYLYIEQLLASLLIIKLYYLYTLSYSIYICSYVQLCTICMRHEHHAEPACRPTEPLPSENLLHKLKCDNNAIFQGDFKGKTRKESTLSQPESESLHKTKPVTIGADATVCAQQLNKY